MICTLKQSLSISVVSKIIPMNISEDEVKEIYDDFVMRHRSLCRLCTEQVKQLAVDVFDLDRKDDAAVKHLVVESAIYSHLYKLLTEKIVALAIEPKPDEEAEIKSEKANKQISRVQCTRDFLIQLLSQTDARR